jgi:hypothetical protein
MASLRRSIVKVQFVPCSRRRRYQKISIHPQALLMGRAQYWAQALPSCVRWVRIPARMGPSSSGKRLCLHPWHSICRPGWTVTRRETPDHETRRNADRYLLSQFELAYRAKLPRARLLDEHRFRGLRLRGAASLNALKFYLDLRGVQAVHDDPVSCRLLLRRSLW